MKWYQHKVVREQWLLLLLILVMCLILGLQTFGPDGSDERFMVVPKEITTSWQAVRSGEATISDVSTFHLGHQCHDAWRCWAFSIQSIVPLDLCGIGGGASRVTLDGGSVPPDSGCRIVGACFS